MTELFEPTSEHDWRLARGRRGLLGAFNDGLCSPPPTSTSPPASVRSAARTTSGCCWPWPSLCARPPGLGLPVARRGPGSAPDLPWPDPEAWADAVRRSTLVDAGVLRWDHRLLYLDRYHRLETQVCDDLVARATAAARRRRGTAGGRGRAGTRRARERPAGGGRGDGGATVDDDPHRRPRHRQDDHGRADAGAAGRPGRRARRADLGRADRADRQGREPAAGGGDRSSPGWPACRTPSTSWAVRRASPCTGCSAGGPTTRRGSGTTAATGSSTT